MSNGYDPVQNVSPDMGPNHLQRVSKVAASMERVNFYTFVYKWILPSDLMQYPWDDPLYSLRVTGYNFLVKLIFVLSNSAVFAISIQ